MAKQRIMVVVGTRPEIIRLSRVIAVLDEKMDLCLVHTGQNYDFELNEVFFKELDIRRPNHFLSAAKATPAATVGQIIAAVDEVFDQEKPEALLVLGDTNSCLAAYPAKRRKIPVFHMEAGNRCFDERVPEEINRRIIDHISDINMPYSAIAREYLLREGLPPDRTIKTGSPMFEVLQHYLPKIQASTVLLRLELKPGGYYLVSAHREENVDDETNFAKLVETLRSLSATRKHPVIVSTHPRTRKWLEQRGAKLTKEVVFLKPQGFLDYVKLEMNAAAVLSDSGTITEESSILNFPALNIRNAHERPEGIEEGAVIMTGLEWERVQQGLAILANQPRDPDRLLRMVADYDAPKVAEKVVRIILSYTDYVRHVVWRE